MTKAHPVAPLEDVDPMKRYEASITKCSNPRHFGADVSVYDSSTGTFHCGLCDVSPQAESAKDTMQKDYAIMKDMLQSSEGIYAKCTELHRNIGARIVYERDVLKSECDRVNAWYSASIDRLTRVRDNSLAELRSVNKQTQTRLKAERSKLTPLVQNMERAAIDIGVRPHRHTGEAPHQRTNQSDAPVVRETKKILDTLSDILNELLLTAQDYYASACVQGPVTRNTIESVVAADVLAPVSEESPHYLSSLNTAVDVALDIVQSSSPSKSSSTPQVSVLSPVAAFNLLHRTAKDVTNKFSVPLVWFALGHCYHRGIGTSSSLQKAVDWYGKAATAGMLWAMEMIAECHADDHWATSEKDKCKSVYADAVHRSVLYRRIAECKSWSEAPTAAALLVRTWALYPFTRDIESLRTDSPSMREYKSTLPTLLRTRFFPRIMRASNEVTHQRDPLALFTLLNVDFRSMVPREEWYDILSQVGNTLSLAPAHYLIAKELLIGLRYYTQSNDNSDDAMSVSSSSATASAVASSSSTATSTSSSSPISYTVTTTTSNGVPNQTRLTWFEKLWKSVEWIHDSAVDRGNNDTLADPLAVLALAELSCDYLEGRFPLACLPSHSSAKKSKVFDWFQGFDADESRLSQVRMLLSRWLHPLIMDGYESARVLSSRLVLTTQYLVAKSEGSNDVSNCDYARVIVESTCPQGSSSAFGLCRRLWMASTTKKKYPYVSKPSALVKCGVIPQQATVYTIRRPSISISTSTSTSTTATTSAAYSDSLITLDPGSAAQTPTIAMLSSYVGRSTSSHLALPFNALSNHVIVLGTAADKGSADARGMIADCHFTAMNNLGVCYEYGTGIVKDESKAFHLDTMWLLGLCYEDGIGVAKDESKAFEWYKKAADRGNATASSKLGMCYEAGIGVAKDWSKAFEWYTKANGLDTASKSLDWTEKGSGRYWG